jgi:hypothetical protein
MARLIGASKGNARVAGPLIAKTMNGEYSYLSQCRVRYVDHPLGIYGKARDPAGELPPRQQELNPREITPGSKIVKVRYGPYLLPNRNWRNMAGEQGMLYNFPDRTVEKYVKPVFSTGNDLKGIDLARNAQSLDSRLD